MQLIEQYSNGIQFITPKLKGQVVDLCLQQNMHREELDRNRKCRKYLKRKINSILLDNEKIER